MGDHSEAGLKHLYKIQPIFCLEISDVQLRISNSNTCLVQVLGVIFLSNVRFYNRIIANQQIFSLYQGNNSTYMLPTVMFC